MLKELKLQNQNKIRKKYLTRKPQRVGSPWRIKDVRSNHIKTDRDDQKAQTLEKIIKHRFY